MIDLNLASGCLGAHLTQSVGCVLPNSPGMHGAPDNIRVKGLTLKNDGDRFATLKKSILITVISSANKVFMTAAIELKLFPRNNKSSYPARLLFLMGINSLRKR